METSKVTGAKPPARLPESSADAPPGGPESDARIWGDAPPDPLAAPDLFQGVMWRRCLAYVLDLLILLVILGLSLVIFLIAGVMSLGLLTPLLWVIFPLIPFAYHSLLIAGRRSATFGMRAFGVEVRGWRGERPEFLQAAVVTALFYLSVGLTSFLILAVALFTPRHRALHDILANVVVVRRQRQESEEAPQPAAGQTSVDPQAP